MRSQRPFSSLENSQRPVVWIVGARQQRIDTGVPDQPIALRIKHNGEPIDAPAAIVVDGDNALRSVLWPFTAYLHVVSTRSLS
ncbi:MAG: hypothetical protein HY709_04270 [Candidatus Latescibacteria bacterium]|nr:hypothetical protein [Candidatus Latescibacterota bacterium]